MSTRQMNSYPKRHYKKWTNTDLISLENMVGKNYSVHIIASRLQRSTTSILWKIANEFGVESKYYKSICGNYNFDASSEASDESQESEDSEESDDSDSDYEPSKYVKRQANVKKIQPTKLYMDDLDLDESEGEGVSSVGEFEYVSESPNAYLEESIEALTQKVWNIETDVEEIKDLVKKYFVSSSKPKNNSSLQGYFFS